jgi:8-oxo-dGTP diphosphatase
MTPVTPVAVTTDLLHALVDGSHAEGVTAMAVESAVEHDGRTLLIAAPGRDFIDDTWHPPTGPVLPGQTLTDALLTALAFVGLTLDEVTGYLGHHDHADTGGQITRVFCFAVTVADPQRICRSAHIGHRWADPDQLPRPLPSPTPPRHAPPASTGTVTRPEPDDPPLAEALRAHVRGVPAAEAGVELLIGHAFWLHRRDFRERFVHTTTTSITGDTAMAHLDWSAAITAVASGELPCSRSEAWMLRLAASLVDGLSVDLRDAVATLDARNADLVSRAVLHASDHPDSSTATPKMPTP